MPHSDPSDLNPAGAARRRLIQALGLGAVAASLSLDWTPPRVRLGSAPAHAAATGLGCEVSYWMTVQGGNSSASNTVLLAASDSNGSTILDSIAFSGLNSGTLSAALFLTESRTVTFGFDYTAPFVNTGTSESFMSFTNSISCCDATQSLAHHLGGTGDTILFFSEVVEDGNCQFS